MNVGSTIVPVEVKAGATGTLRSLLGFVQEHASPVGLRFSQQPLSLHDGILSVPLYAVATSAALVRQAIAGRSSDAQTPQ